MSTTSGLGPVPPTPPAPSSGSASRPSICVPSGPAQRSSRTRNRRDCASPALSAVHASGSRPRRSRTTCGGTAGVERMVSAEPSASGTTAGCHREFRQLAASACTVTLSCPAAPPSPAAPASGVPAAPASQRGGVGQGQRVTAGGRLSPAPRGAQVVPAGQPQTAAVRPAQPGHVQVGRQCRGRRGGAGLVQPQQPHLAGQQAPVAGPALDAGHHPAVRADRRAGQLPGRLQQHPLPGPRRVQLLQPAVIPAGLGRVVAGDHDRPAAGNRRELPDRQVSRANRRGIAGRRGPPATAAGTPRRLPAAERPGPARRRAAACPR